MHRVVRQPLSPNRSTPRAGVVGCCALLAVCVLIASGCQPQVNERFSIIASGDTAGWIVPCGCTSSQSGGLPRRATLLAQERQAGPVIAVDVGGAAKGTSEYDRLRFGAILQGEAAMGVMAHNVGASELSLGQRVLDELGKASGVELISANIYDRVGQLWREPLKIVSAGGRRIAFVGVISPRYATDRVTIKPALESVLATLAAHRQKFDLAIVLAYLDEGELAALAEGLPEVDLVLGGPTGQSVAPRRSGPTWLASATNKGKYVARFEHTAKSATPWQGKIVELDGQFADDSAQVTNLKRFYEQLEARDLPADQTGLAPRTAWPADFRAAGTSACRRCHTVDADHWQASPHAQAWETLVAKGAQFDASCQLCHTTAFGLPGGFVSAKRSLAAQSVGCESCHGPSQAHADRPAVATAYAADVKQQCVRCHDEENSPRFKYDTYWPRIAHGQPANAPTDTVSSAAANCDGSPSLTIRSTARLVGENSMREALP